MTQRVGWARSLAVVAACGGLAGCDTFTEPDPPPSACTYALSPAEFTPCMATPDELVLTVIAPDTCPWSTSSSAAWLAAAGATEGTGSGSIRYRIADNWESPRLGLISLRGALPGQGRDVRVSQAGCRYWISQKQVGIPAAGGTFAFEVLQQSEPLTCGGPLQNACAWSAVEDVSWILIATPMPRMGDHLVSFTVADNSGATARTGTITVRDQVVQVTQAGR